MTQKLSLGETFRQKFVATYQQPNCGCRDAAAMLNRWGIERSRKSINRLVEMVFAKSRGVSRDEIKSILVNAIAEYELKNANP